jgi:hypothetical protein
MSRTQRKMKSNKIKTKKTLRKKVLKTFTKMSMEIKKRRKSHMETVTQKMS